MISFLSNLIIILGAIFFAYFSWRKIELGIYAIVFCLPLYLVRLNIFSIPTTAIELGIYLLFIIWIAKNYRRVKLREIIPDKTLQTGIILLLAGAAISTIFSVDLKTSAGILKGWFFDLFLFFIILVSEIKTLKQRENTLKALFFSGLAVALASLTYLIFPELNGVSYDGRLSSFYLSPNYLAMYLSPALIIGIWLIYRAFGVDFLKRKIISGKFFLSIISLVVIALAIYFTYSYAAWFAIAVSVFMLIYLIAPLVKRKILFGISLLILIGIFISQAGTDKFGNLKNLSYRSSYNSRLMIWRSAWEIGKDNWLIGIGPGNFQKYYLDYQTKFSEPYLEWAVPEPHNIFLAFWLETGLLGFLGFLALLAWFFKKSLKLLKGNVSVENFNSDMVRLASLKLRRSGQAYHDKKTSCHPELVEGQSDLLGKENFLFVAVLLSIMVYTVTHGLFDTTYWKNDLAIIFWLNLVLLVSIKK